jgi:hypothetical protein
VRIGEGIIFERVPEMSHQRKLLVVGKVERRHNRVIWCADRAWRWVSDLDIWRAASLLIRKHGAKPELEAAERADLMLDRGDYDGQHQSAGTRWAIEDLPARRRGRIGLRRGERG